MTIEYLASNSFRNMKQTWINRYEDKLKSIAVMNMSIAADGGETKPKNIFTCKKNVEATIPFKKRLNSYRYEDFQPVSEEKKEPIAMEKKNLRPRNSRLNSDDVEKQRFVPEPYEKPVTRRQTRKPASEKTPEPTPTPKVQTNGKRKRKSGKENKEKTNNCDPSTSKVEINSSTKPSVNEPKEQQQQQQQQELLTQQQQPKKQDEQKQSKLNTTATELKGADLIALLKMVAKKESSESKAIVDMVESDDEPIDYSIKPKKEAKILIQKKTSPSTSNKRKRKPKATMVQPLKIRLVSTSIQGMALNTAH